MNSPRSAAEVFAEDTLIKFRLLIKHNKVEVGDAEYMELMVTKLLLKCTELREGRDQASRRRTQVQELWQKEKKAHQHTLKRLREAQEN